jgi:hypothetical protein
MDEASCLFVLSLLMDGRPVEPALERAARVYAASHPECERALADWQAQSAALAASPPRTASAGFTERVLAAAGVAAPVRAAGAVAARPVEPQARFARQLAVAAGIALLLSLVVVLARPADLRADAGIQRHRHAVDGFRASPFAPDDIDAGLRARLLDAEFGARPGSHP